MTPEKRLYTLMAHAEDLQTHAQTLQSRARTELEGLPEIVRDAGREVRAQAARWIVVGIAIVIAVGIVMAGGVSVYLRHDVETLRAEADALQAEIAEMEQTAAELTKKTWGLRLAQWDDERGIVLPRGVTVDRTAPLSDNSGRIAIILKP